MQMAITLITVVGGLVFSVAFAVVVEEFIFGEIFRTFFALPVAVKQEPSGKH
jgi:ABC-type sugar transport system permease subunit